MVRVVKAVDDLGQRRGLIVKMYQLFWKLLKELL